MKRHLTPEERAQRSLKMLAHWAKKRAAASAAPPTNPEDATNSVPVSTLPEIVDPPSSERSLKQQSRAVQARWAGEAATEDSLRQHFLSAPLDRALALLDRMRKNCEIAGRILNDRVNTPEVQRCKTCKLTWEQFVKTSRRSDWFLNRPHYHPNDRNIILVDHFCSAACVSLENNKTQGVYGLSDSGMTRDMNPSNHPTFDVKAAHEKAV